MDHWPLPRDPVFGRIPVPLICDPEDSAGYDFLEYPLHAQPEPWPEVLNRPGEWTFVSLEQTKPRPEGQLKSFLQSWLYFSLLKTFLEPYIVLKPENYIEGQDCKRLVHTRQLPHHLDVWVSKVKQVDESVKSPLIVRLHDHLTLAQSTLTNIKARKPRYNDPIWMSLAALGELLNFALNAVGTYEQSAYHHTIWPLQPEDKKVMLDNGWCPNEICNTYSIPREMSFFSYQWNMRKPTTAAGHADCRDDRCLQAQTTKETYKQSHTEEHCSCPLITVPESSLHMCHDDGTYPLLEVGGDSVEDVTVDVVPYNGHLAYIALSHVWADGLGNTVLNAMPSCQLLRLKQLCRDLEGRTFTTWTGENKDIETTMTVHKLYFWCDTICCPIDPSRKQQALTRMQSIYRQSSYTLVLESSIEHYSFADIGPLEAVLRITSSKWGYRMWTMQEAGLPDKLLIKFADGIFDFREIWRGVEDVYRSSDRAQHAIYRQAHLMCVALRIWFRADLWDSTSVPVTSALQNYAVRNLSVPSDEVYCLSTLFGLDVSQISAMAEDQKMPMFWQLFTQRRSVSQSIIFNKQPRLKTPGYQWAPSTLLGADKDLMLALGQKTDVQATHTSHGLLLHAKAQKLQAAPLPTGICRPYLAACLLRKPHTVLLRDMRGNWHDLIATAKLGAIAGSDKPSLADFNGGPDPALMGGRDFCDLIRDQPKKEWYMLLDANRLSTASEHSWSRGMLANPVSVQDNVPVMQSVVLTHCIALHSVQNRLRQVTYCYAVAVQALSCFRCLVAIDRVEAALLMAASLLPPCGVVLRLAVLRHIRTIVETCCLQCLFHAGKHAQTNEQLQQVWAAGISLTPHQIAAVMLPMFCSQHIEVIAELDRQWYIQ